MNSLWQSILRFYASSIGKKILVALSGLALMGFLLGHLWGNLLVFKGPDAMNEYAALLHSHPGYLWVARLGLLGMVGLHIAATVQLTIMNRLARPEQYQSDATLRASRSSKIMILSGLTILAFVVYHLMHFTWGTFSGVYDPKGGYYLPDGHHNTYKMVVDGFKNGANTFFYLIAMALLTSHLSHGFASLFQTLGLTTKRSRPLIQVASWVFALALFAGFVSIPLAIFFKFVR